MSSEASHACQNKAKNMCQVTKGPLNNCSVQTKNNLKPNDFKQFTTWNELSRRSKFPDKI